MITLIDKIKTAMNDMMTQMCKNLPGEMASIIKSILSVLSSFTDSMSGFVELAWEKLIQSFSDLKNLIKTEASNIISKNSKKFKESISAQKEECVEIKELMKKLVITASTSGSVAGGGMAINCATYTSVGAHKKYDAEDVGFSGAATGESMKDTAPLLLVNPPAFAAGNGSVFASQLFSRLFGKNTIIAGAIGFCLALSLISVIIYVTKKDDKYYLCITKYNEEYYKMLQVITSSNFESVDYSDYGTCKEFDDDEINIASSNLNYNTLKYGALSFPKRYGPGSFSFLSRTVLKAGIDGLLNKITSPVKTYLVNGVLVNYPTAQVVANTALNLISSMASHGAMSILASKCSYLVRDTAVTRQLNPDDKLTAFSGVLSGATAFSQLTSNYEADLIIYGGGNSADVPVGVILKNTGDGRIVISFIGSSPGQLGSQVADAIWSRYGTALPSDYLAGASGLPKSTILTEGSQYSLEQLFKAPTSIISGFPAGSAIDQIAQYILSQSSGGRKVEIILNGHSLGGGLVAVIKPALAQIFSQKIIDGLIDITATTYAPAGHLKKSIHDSLMGNNPAYKKIVEGSWGISMSDTIGVTDIVCNGCAISGGLAKEYGVPTLLGTSGNNIETAVIGPYTYGVGNPLTLLKLHTDSETLVESLNIMATDTGGGNVVLSNVNTELLQKTKGFVDSIGCNIEK